MVLLCHLLITFANNLDPTKCHTRSGPNLFDTQMVFLKAFFR